MSEKCAWGPDNPHPLSRMKTELVWEGKYDEYGNRRPVKLPETPLPLQKIETVDAPRDAAKALATRQGDLFDQETFTKSSHRDDFRNMLIWGDNKLALAALLKEYRGAVDLIYIDPPFDVGNDFKLNVEVGEESDRLEKQQSVLEAVAYRDTWGLGTDSYLHMMCERLSLARDLLSERGTIYVHSDWHVGHFLKAIASELFLEDNFINELTWHYYNKMAPVSKCFPRASDRILSFARSHGNHIFHQQFEKRDKPVKQLKRKFIGGKPINVRDEDGAVQYQMREDRRLDDVWRISMLQPADKTQYVGYGTQKPETMLERIISASSEPGSLVLDFFCGSGTTCAVAERLGRKWIGVDLGRYAIHTTRKRLIQVQRKLHAKGEAYRSFDVYNLGRYERQWWQMDRLKGSDEEHRALVLKFFKAMPLANSPNPIIHATKGGAYVHVDEIDGLLSFDELRQVARAAANIAGVEDLHMTGLAPTGKRVKLICLAWEFEMDLRMRAQALEAELGIDIALTYIPREIMEANRNEIQFFDAGAVEAETVRTEEDTIEVKLTGFYPALTEVPDKEMEALRERAVKSPFDFIDFWAVDFEHADGKPFEHHWQDFRTRKDRSLLTTSTSGWKYETPGRKRICVKVIDVFGVDTTKVIEVDV